MNGFQEVFASDALRRRKVGNAAGYPQDAVVGSGRKGQLFHGLLEEVTLGAIQGAVGAELLASEDRIAGPHPSPEPLSLNRSGSFNANAHGLGRLAGLGMPEFLNGECGGFDLDINAV